MTKVVRQTLWISLFAIMLSSCDDGNTRNGPTMLTESTSTVRAEEQERARGYAAASKDAVPRRSELRSRIIANGEKYSDNYPFTDRLSQMSPEFKCAHPEDIIDRAESDGWLLVSCNNMGPMFLRPRSESLGCSEIEAPADEYDVLRISINPVARYGKSLEDTFDFSMRVDVISAGDALSSIDRISAIEELGWEVPAHVELYRRSMSPQPPTHFVDKENLIHSVYFANDENDCIGPRLQVKAYSAAAIAWLVSHEGSYEESVEIAASALRYVDP